MKRKKIQWFKLAVCLAIPLAAGGLSAFLTRDSMKIFGSLAQPPLSPPAWLFPVMWTALYILMGLACYFVITSPKVRYENQPDMHRALFWYGLQLFFNFCWPIAFFILRVWMISLIWLAVMEILIIAVTVSFAKFSGKAVLMMIPYILWTAFAGYLNWGIFILN